MASVPGWKSAARLRGLTPPPISACRSNSIQDNDEARVEVHRKPLGVVGSITPWNWPLLIAIWHVIPALRAGNTVVIKPSVADSGRHREVR